ncbi:NAD(P) transhydrogenase subunit alpha [Dactylosporangium sp. AC04546]|uniref:NAD(P) transhydrogenase subunit alpha n=1 Tax=Dactylosporangium sp. AC04546 TaxID=2862460 RepID=UPI001EDCF709|nr:NAD(P) transhydrogenase subunit alpha [Dactylosporangium sp. AC04546]WVK78619.1 NAD(P) transhydrogenase subunit alpha [Dactylosporangium sp. AC04546]
MAHQTVGVYSETAPGERRVALVPAAVGSVLDLGLAVVVETGAGRGAWFPDSAYTRAGARTVPRAELFDAADILIGVRPPNVAATHRFRAGQALVCLLQPLHVPDLIRRWAGQGLTTIAADLMPPTPGRAGPMDLFAAQERIAGYQATLSAAGLFGRCLAEPGPGPPARVLVVGRGPAGLQAAATARRLGAVVHVRAARPGSGAARPGFGADLAASVRGSDIVIVTAETPGGQPPELVSARSIRSMRPGSVVLDTTAGALGRAVELAQPGGTRVVEPGVTVVGDDNLASRTPTGASTAYATSVAALLTHLVRDGALSIDRTDPAQAAVVVTHHRDVLNDAVWQRILDQISLAGLP